MKPMIVLLALGAVSLACSEPASPPRRRRRRHTGAGRTGRAGPFSAARGPSQILGSLPDEASSETNP